MAAGRSSLVTWAGSPWVLGVDGLVGGVGRPGLAGAGVGGTPVVVVGTVTDGGGGGGTAIWANAGALTNSDKVMNEIILRMPDVDAKRVPVRNGESAVVKRTSNERIECGGVLRFS
jgi:hypothetical protein